MINLAMCFCQGWGVAQSYAEARQLYERAVATNQHPEDIANLQVHNADIARACPLLGQRVVLRGLNTEALNGTRGTAVDFGYSERAPGPGALPGAVNWVIASGRYTVKLDGPEGRLVKVRVANVEEEEDDWTAGAGGGGGGGGKNKGAGKKGHRRRKK